MLKMIAALLVLGLNTYVYWYFDSEEVIPDRAQFVEFPNEIGNWKCTNRDVLDEKIIRTLQVTDYVSCGFVNEAANSALHLYVGYHERQTRNRDTGTASAIHPPEHCLPGSGWDVIDSTIIPITAGHGGEAKRFVIAKGNRRQLVYFWYQSRGRVIARNHEKISYMFLDRAMRGRTDGSLVRFTVPIEFGDIEAAEARFNEFANQVTPLLTAYVPD